MSFPPGGWSAITLGGGRSIQLSYADNYKYILHLQNILIIHDFNCFAILFYFRSHLLKAAYVKYRFPGFPILSAVFQHYTRFSAFSDVINSFPGFPCSPRFPHDFFIQVLPIPGFSKISGFSLSILFFQSSVFQAEHCQVVELFGVFDEIIDIGHDFFEGLFGAEAAVCI